MKFDSPLFDRIRVKPEKDRRPKTGGPSCEWHGCKEKRRTARPKDAGARRTIGASVSITCANTTRRINFFAGMSDAAVMAYQKDALTGHRPTWKMGAGKGTVRPDIGAFGSHTDPFGLFGEGVRAEQKARAETRPIRNAERKALDTLGPRCGRHLTANENAIQGTGETPIIRTPMVATAQPRTGWWRSSKHTTT